MFPKVDSVNLSIAHSCVIGHKPQAIDLSQFSEVDTKVGNQKDVTSLGLFGDSPNYATFYPDVTSEEFTPKDEDYIYPVFRLLSEVTVHKSWNPISFAKPGILKESMNLLVGATVNADHQTEIGNAMGTVSEVQWQDSYQDKNGVEVPAGIMGTLKIDAKSNPRIARGILSSPPSIHSNSVTVFFKWEKSHPEMDNEEFMAKLGNYDESGNLIQRVVNEVVGYSETSLVGMGADPFAQITGEDGKINNPTFADRRMAKLAEKAEQAGASPYMSFKSVTSLQSTIPVESINNGNSEPELSDMEYATLAEQFSLTLPEGQTEWTQELMADALNEVKANTESLQESVDNLKSELKVAQQDLADQKILNDELQSDAQIGRQALEAAREKSENLYTALCGDKAPSAAIIATLKAADYDTSLEFIREYESQLEDGTPASHGEGSEGTPTETAPVNLAEKVRLARKKKGYGKK